MCSIYNPILHLFTLPFQPRPRQQQQHMTTSTTTTTTTTVTTTMRPNTTITTLASDGARDASRALGTFFFIFLFCILTGFFQLDFFSPSPAATAAARRDDDDALKRCEMSFERQVFCFFFLFLFIVLTVIY